MKQILPFSLLALLLSACASGTSPSGTTLSYTAVGGTAPLAETVLTATLSSPSARGIVNRFDHTIKFYLASGATLTSLSPSFVNMSGTPLTPTPSTPQDLSSAVDYSFSDGSHYSVQAYNSAAPSAATVNGWIGHGINLGNDLDAWPGVEGSWTGGVVVQKTFFDDYKNMGFTSVRVPVTWGGATTPADRLSNAGAGSVVNSTFMTRVDTVVGWGIDAGLTIVLNAHHEDWIRTKTGATFTAQKARFVALWTQIATHFKDWPPQLVFEIINEPQGAITNAEVRDLNSAVLTVIRATNPTRTVIIGANSWNSIGALQASDFLPLPTDSNLIATFHNYNPWSFAGQSTGSWGSATDIQNMTNDLTNVANWASSHSIPVYMGEYGVTLISSGKKTDLDSRTAWYKNTYQIAKAKGISMAAWDDFGDFKLYDRANHKMDANIISLITAP